MKFNRRDSFLILPLLIAQQASFTLQARADEISSSQDPDKDSDFAPDTSPRVIHLIPAIGFTLIRPSELNDQLTANRFNGESTGTEITWSTALSLSLNYTISRYLSAGARIEYANTQSSHRQTLNDFGVALNQGLSWLAPYATLEAQLPVSDPVSVGVSGGAGVPVIYQLSLEASVSENAQLRKGEVTYGAHPLCAYLGAFATFALSERAGLRLEAGYQWLKATSMTALSQGQDAFSAIHTGDDFRNKQGAVAVDSSAPYFKGGLVISL